MTSLVALATKDSLVLGCDSLGTSTKNLIDPVDLISYFDPQKDFEIKKDENGNPLLKNFRAVYDKVQPVPHTHMTHMNKLFSLSPLEMGLMTTGIASIGDRTVKSLIEEFKRKESMFRRKPKAKNYTVHSVANKIIKFICTFYEKEYPDEKQRPYLELILGGYDKQRPVPKIMRVKLPKKDVEQTLGEAKFGIAFGGQMKEIQRIVFGTDSWNSIKINNRHIELLRKYREIVNDFLRQNDANITIPELSMKEIEELDMFNNNWSLDGFNAAWADFSEQNAIECVDFFVNIMIKSQQFSEGMPTVGGEVHIALITKTKGFRFISKEEYSHGGHFIPKEIENKKF